MSRGGKNILTRKLLFLSLFIIIFFNLTSCSKDSSKNGNVTINVYNWGEFISSGVDGTLNINEEFTRKTGINVNYTTFQSNEEMYAKLASGGANYDVIIPSDYMIGRLINDNMLQKLDSSSIPNYSLIDDKFKNLSYDPYNEYSIPYAWGLVGIFYNKSMVSEKEEDITWDILWNKKYSGQILMFDNARDSFNISLMRKGLSINSPNPDDWYAAGKDLKNQKPLIQAYVMDQIFDKMGNGEAAIAPYYAGDAAILTKSNPNIGFVIPKEKSMMFVDAMCIPVRAEHPNEAMSYINFMCETEIAKANIEYIGYSTPHKEVKKLLDDDIASNEIYYPSDETLKNVEVIKNLPNEINSILDKLWVEVKVGQSGGTIGLLIVFVGFIILYFSILFYKRSKTKK